MPFDTLIKDLVKTASKILDDGKLMVTVQHAVKSATRTEDGMPQWGADTARKAVLVEEDRIVKRPDGKETISRSQALFLETLAIGIEDRITLADGTKPTIIAVSNGVLAKDGNAFLTQVFFE